MEGAHLWIAQAREGPSLNNNSNNKRFNNYFKYLLLFSLKVILNLINQSTKYNFNLIYWLIMSSSFFFSKEHPVN